MSEVAFGRTVRLVTKRSTTRGDFRIGLEAVEKATGRLSIDPDVQYEGDGISFRRGDVLFGKLRPNLRKAWLADTDGDAVGDFHVYRPVPSLMTSRYLAYLVLSEPFLEPVIASVYGAKMPRADWGDVRNIKVWVPDPPEQRAIADYLDRETAQIDAFIAKNEELITLLTERRSALVASRVMGQVGSGGGEKLGYRCRLGNGSTPRRDDSRYWDGGAFPWLNSAVVNLDRVRYSDQFVTETARAECHLPTIKPGAIVVGLTGEGRTRGMATIVDIEATMNQHLGYIQPDSRYWDPEYLFWLLRSRYRWLRDASDANGATKGGLTIEQLRSMRVERPDLLEQRAVANEIHQVTARISDAIEVARSGVQIARERRAALISVAVTGKITVGVTA